MRSDVLDAPRGVFRDPAGSLRFTNFVLGVAEAELRKLRRDPVELLSRAIQPTLWLVVFGQMMARARGFPTENLPYLDFVTPGILAQSVLFIAILYGGVSILAQRDLGVLHKYLVSPAPRTALVLGKALSAGARGLSQAVIIYLLALLMKIGVSFQALNVCGVLVLVVVESAVFASLAMIIACLVKTRERFIALAQAFIMPLFFASNAIYPLSLMPPWLRAISAINPLTYQVDAFRALMVHGGSTTFSLPVDVAVLLGVLVVFVRMAARLLRRVVLW